MGSLQMYELAKIVGYLLSPLTIVLGLALLAGLCALVRRYRLAASLAVSAFVILWIASLPALAFALTAELESGYPVLTAQTAPVADAIVVLGGSVVGRHPTKRPTFGLSSASTRVWFAADLYRAGKAKWIVVAAGGTPELAGQEVEADAIAAMLVALGVPPKAILREDQSRTTRENAANSLPLLRSIGARKVLLVTSAQHMRRALKTFELAWKQELDITPAPTDVEALESRYPAYMWIPSPNALSGVTKALKEYAGMVALAIM
jgi:uncharacterized SAM-binding protein YcdF (DUF218 family)